jgi:hypothetical protein
LSVIEAASRGIESRESMPTKGDSRPENWTRSNVSSILERGLLPTTKTNPAILALVENHGRSHSSDWHFYFSITSILLSDGSAVFCVFFKHSNRH